MNDLFLDRESMRRRLGDVGARIESLEDALDRIPAVPDGGVASAIIALIATAAAEAAGIATDTGRALTAVSLDVLDDLSSTDDEIAADLAEMANVMEER